MTNLNTIKIYDNTPDVVRNEIHDKFTARIGENRRSTEAQNQINEI
ncbi:hypothetical protein ACLJJ6_04390 [Pediococcus siamensis]